jgi:hypothetical protein
MRRSLFFSHLGDAVHRVAVGQLEDPGDARPRSRRLNRRDRPHIAQRSSGDVRANACEPRQGFQMCPATDATTRLRRSDNESTMSASALTVAHGGALAST